MNLDMGALIAGAKYQVSPLPACASLHAALASRWKGEELCQCARSGRDVIGMEGGRGGVTIAVCANLGQSGKSVAHPWCRRY
eukprot:3675519-Rhodomonas_salina.2